MTTFALDSLVESAANFAEHIDASATDLRQPLAAIIQAGHAAYGLSDSQHPIALQAQTISALAEQCLSTAFVTWSHRMASEYVDRWASPQLKETYLPQLLNGTRIGSTALATALADKSGKEVLPITFERQDNDFVISGVIPWASNLYPDTLVVFAARNPLTEERAVFAATLDTAGISVKPAGKLLALNATASGTIKFDGLVLGANNLLTLNIDGFLGQMRPRFLVLQSAFCIGLIRASLSAISTANGLEPFADEVAGYLQELDELQQQLDQLSAGLAEYPAPGNGHAPLNYLKLRLRAAQLAQAVARVELATVGGRGYYQGSATSRRIRESLFLSVQAPTEGSLRWEISQLS